MKKKFERVFALFLATLIVISMVGCGGTPSEASGDGGDGGGADGDTVVIRVNSAFNSATVDETANGKAALAFVDAVAERTNGKYEIKLFMDSQLGGSTDQVVGGLQTGAFEMCTKAVGDFGEFTDAFMPFNFPYLFSSPEVVHAVIDGPVGDRIRQDCIDDVGIRILAFTELGYRHVTNSKHPIKTPDDMKGLKIRTMNDPYQIAAMEALGASATPMSYLNYINNHIIPQLEDIKLDKLTTIQIQKFYNDLQKNGRVQRYKHIQLKNKGLSVRVVHGIHTLLNNCLEQAVAERLILVNPTRGCKLPKMEKREMKVLPEEKIRPYLMEADKRGLLAPFYLELTTGLRRGELLALLWTDLDVENRTISITKQVTRTKGELVVSQPKTHNSIRVLPVSQQAVDLLVEEHKKHPGNPYMFPSPKTGGMFDPDSFRHTHEKILKAIGAEHIRFHDLRHTFATLSLKNGVDVKTLSSTLGHYSAGFTLSTYTHATPDMMREAADTMGDVIGKAM